MPEDNGPSFKSGALFELQGKRIGDPSEPSMTELVSFSALHDWAILGSKLRSLCHHHYAEISAALVSPPDFGCDLVYIEGLFRDQNDISSACYAAVDSNPSGIASHDFNYHYTIVGLSRGVNPINRFRHNIDRGIEPKSEIGSGKIV